MHINFKSRAIRVEWPIEGRLLCQLEYVTAKDLARFLCGLLRFREHEQSLPLIMNPAPPLYNPFSRYRKIRPQNYKYGSLECLTYLAAQQHVKLAMPQPAVECRHVTPSRKLLSVLGNWNCIKVLTPVDSVLRVRLPLPCGTGRERT